MQWEYEVVKVENIINLPEILNSFGVNRWELVNANYIHDAYGIPEVELIFKRSKSIGLTFIVADEKGHYEQVR